MYSDGLFGDHGPQGSTRAIDTALPSYKFFHSCHLASSGELESEARRGRELAYVRPVGRRRSANEVRRRRGVRQTNQANRRNLLLARWAPDLRATPLSRSTTPSLYIDHIYAITTRKCTCTSSVTDEATFVDHRYRDGHPVFSEHPPKNARDTPFHHDESLRLRRRTAPGGELPRMLMTVRRERLAPLLR